MQSYCDFCIYTTFYAIKAYVFTIKNKLTNKTLYSYTLFVAEVKASAASNNTYHINEHEVRGISILLGWCT